MSEKPKLVPIPTPINVEAVEDDLSQPFPIKIGVTYYNDAEEYKRARRAQAEGIGQVHH